MKARTYVSFAIVLAVTLLGAFGDALVFGLSLALASVLFHGPARKRAISGTIASLSAGAIVGVPVVTFVGDVLGWRMALGALGMACLAIGQLLSALTENQIIAALFTVSVLLGFWFVGHLENFQSAYGLRRLFVYLSFSRHFGEFILGLVRTEAVAFFLIVSAIALTLNVSYLQWRR